MSKVYITQRVERGISVHVRWPKDEDKPFEGLVCMDAIVVDVHEKEGGAFSTDVVRHKVPGECSGLILTSGLPHSSTTDFVSWHLPEECE